MKIKVGQTFEYVGAPHRIIEITSQVVVTERVDKENDTAIIWDKEGLQFLLDNAEYYHIKQLVN